MLFWKNKSSLLMFLKAEIQNTDMSLSMPEKSVTAEKEDDKNGHHHYFYINGSKSNSCSQNCLCFQVTQRRDQVWTCWVLLPKQTQVGAIGFKYSSVFICPLCAWTHLICLGSVQSFRLCLRRNRLLPRKQYAPLHCSVSPHSEHVYNFTNAASLCSWLLRKVV